MSVGGGARRGARARDSRPGAPRPSSSFIETLSLPDSLPGRPRQRPPDPARPGHPHRFRSGDGRRVGGAVRGPRGAWPRRRRRRADPPDARAPRPLRPRRAGRGGVGRGNLGRRPRPQQLPADAQPEAPPRRHGPLGLRHRDALRRHGVGRRRRPVREASRGVGRAEGRGDAGGRRMERARPLGAGPHSGQPHVRGARGGRSLHGRHGPQGDHAQRRRGRGPPSSRGFPSAASRATSGRSRRSAGRTPARPSSRATARRSRTGTRTRAGSTGATDSGSTRSSESSRRVPRPCAIWSTRSSRA